MQNLGNLLSPGVGSADCLAYLSSQWFKRPRACQILEQAGRTPGEMKKSPPFPAAEHSAAFCCLKGTGRSLYEYGGHDPVSSNALERVKYNTCWTFYQYSLINGASQWFLRSFYGIYAAIKSFYTFEYRTKFSRTNFLQFMKFCCISWFHITFCYADPLQWFKTQRLLRIQNGKYTWN